MNKSPLAAQAALSGLLTPLAGAILTFYSGSQPSSPSVALGASNLALVVTTIAAFGPVNLTGTQAIAYATFGASLYTVLNSGNASFARAVGPSGTLLDFSVATAGADINLITVALAAGAPFFPPILSIGMTYP